MTAASFTVFCGPSYAYGYAKTFTTGGDWVQRMSSQEKFMTLIVPMNLFHRYGVSFRKSSTEYIRILDQVLLDNPYIENEDVANIFASFVYITEPESRPVFRLMQLRFEGRKSFLDGDFVYDAIKV